MNRRELLKALLPVASAPVLVKGAEVGKAFKIEPDAKYLVFLNETVVSYELLDQIAQSAPLPAGTPLYLISPSRNGGMDEAIRIFKV